MNNFQKCPLKIYIQDIFRAKRSAENKYIYEIFGMNFKNIMIHGVVTSVYNITATSSNLEISDLTGSVQVYFDSSKSNHKIAEGTLKDLRREYTSASQFGDINIDIMNTLMSKITDASKRVITEGSYLSIIGDIFVDETKNVRMVSAFECSETSEQRDIVWMEELRYLYEKFYLWEKE
ncbi:uncharacterized protein LOC114356008 [Ostrinia furnacalis]|uniref:uncharacterized protein LOC114356008 n=1 Tax=Ostrinia furnacalis TaxID=93504 RepID=UPI00103E3730|nr:uncharacterized protein LOC114356008 [Ostrinia furnacalis]